MLLILNGFLNDGSDSIYQFEFDADSFEGQHNVGEENCGVYSKVGDSVGCDFCRQFRGLAYRENVMLCSDLLIAFEISACLSHEPDWSVLCLFPPAGSEKIVILEFGHALFAIDLSWSQKVKHLLRSDGDTCENGRLDRGVSACFATAQVHYQVKKIPRMVRLK